MITERVLFIETTLRADKILEIQLGVDEEFSNMNDYVLSALTKNFSKKCIQKCLILKFLNIIEYKPYDEFLFPVSDNENLFVTIRVCCKALVEVIIPHEPYLAVVRSIQGENEAYGNIIMLEIKFSSNVRTVIPVSKHIKYANLLEVGQYVFIYGKEIKTKNLNSSLTFVDINLFNIFAFDKKKYVVVEDDDTIPEIRPLQSENLENINSMFRIVFDFGKFDKGKKKIPSGEIKANRVYSIDHSEIKSSLSVVEEAESPDQIKIQKSVFLELLRLWRDIRFELAKNFFRFKTNINMRSNPISLIRYMNKIELENLTTKRVSSRGT